MIISPPAGTDFGFYNTYVSNATEKNLLEALRDNLDTVLQIYNGLGADMLDFRYDTGKWSLKEVLLHLTDAERNFCYRAMRISRGDQTPVPGYDIHASVINGMADARDIKKIMNEFETARKATIAMYEGMPEAMLDLTGPARDTMMSVRALGFALLGHTKHHMEIIKERYLVAITSVE